MRLMAPRRVPMRRARSARETGCQARTRFRRIWRLMARGVPRPATRTGSWWMRFTIGLLVAPGDRMTPGRRMFVCSADNMRPQRRRQSRQILASNRAIRRAGDGLDSRRDDGYIVSRETNVPRPASRPPGSSIEGCAVIKKTTFITRAARRPDGVPAGARRQRPGHRRHDCRHHHGLERRRAARRHRHGPERGHGLQPHRAHRTRSAPTASSSCRSATTSSRSCSPASRPSPAAASSCG